MSKRLAPLFALLALVAIISAVISLLVARANNRIPAVTDFQKFDAWLHRQLGVTEEQEAAMAQNEGAFHSRQQELIGELRRLNRDLATALVEEKEETPRVRAILEEIHRVQGELQSVTIRHVFEMREHLSPEQYERLLTLTAAALKTGSQAEPQP